MSRTPLLSRPPTGPWIALAALLTLALAAGAALSQELGDEDYVKGFKPRISRIDGHIRAAKALRVDDEAYSLSTVMNKIGRRPDPQPAFFFVRDKIAFEPYEGAQRGVTGTLMARAGNSLDKALLLRAMLDELKIKTRLVKGRLAPDDARRLLEAFAGAGTLQGKVPKGMDSFAPGTDRRLVGAVSWHYWLEAYVNGDWVHLDPSFPRGVYGVAVARKEADFPELPPEATPTISLRVYAVDKAGVDQRVLDVNGFMEDMLHRNIVLTFDPVPGRPDDRQPRAVVTGKTTQGKRFAWTGLQRLSVEIFFNRGKVQDRVVRDLYVGTSAPSLFQSDQQVFSVMILPAWVPEDFIRAVARQELPGIHDDSRPVAATLEKELKKAMLESEVGPQFSEYIEGMLGRAGGLIALAHASVSDRAALSMASAHGVRAFYDAPRVIMVAGIRHKDRLYWQLDLRRNDIRAVPAAGLPPVMGQAFHALRGRFDSQFEAAVLTSLTGKPSLSVGGIVEAAEREKLPMVTITAATVDQLIGRLQVSDEARERIAHGVRTNNKVALVPGRSPEIGGARTVGWWELDPNGAILGVRENGTHGAGDFDASALTGESTAAVRKGGIRILVFDEALTLIDHVAETVVALLNSVPDVCPVVCATSRDLARIPGQLCQHGVASPEPPLSLEACMMPTTDGGDLLGMNKSCADRVRPTSCGAQMARAVLAGTLKVQITTPPVSSTTGPYDPASLPPVMHAACGCK